MAHYLPPRTRLAPSLLTSRTLIARSHTLFTFTRRAVSSSNSSTSTASARSRSAFAYASTNKVESASGQSLFHRFRNSQQERPYTTQVWTFVGLWLVGDLSAQLIFPATDIDESTGELKRQPYDGWRTIRHLFIATTVAIPSYKWFMIISRNFNCKGSKVLSLAVKVAVQQAVYTPFFNLYFFSMHSLLAGKSWSDTAEHLRLTLPKSISNGIGVWTAAAVVNFTAVPAPLQGLFMGCVAVGWQIYLSWLNQMFGSTKMVE